MLRRQSRVLLSSIAVNLDSQGLEPGALAVRIVIEDDGPGIPEADFERVFAPFVRLEESRSRETGASGSAWRSRARSCAATAATLSSPTANKAACGS
jgi:hypothetical protein